MKSIVKYVIDETLIPNSEGNHNLVEIGNTHRPRYSGSPLLWVLCALVGPDFSLYILKEIILFLTHISVLFTQSNRATVVPPHWVLRPLAGTHFSIYIMKEIILFLTPLSVFVYRKNTTPTLQVGVHQDSYMTLQQLTIRPTNKLKINFHYFSIYDFWRSHSHVLNCCF